jgi:hypothetical protein
VIQSLLSIRTAASPMNAARASFLLLCAGLAASACAAEAPVDSAEITASSLRSRAVQKMPESLAGEAAAALRKGDYDEAARLMERAIKANQGDVGIDYDPWKFPKLADEALDHGRSQLLKMLANRPLMDAHLAVSDDLWKWTSRKYASKVFAGDIVWDDSPPTGQAEHIPPDVAGTGKIRVKNAPADLNAKKEAAAFEDLWSSAVFELHNIHNAAEFNRLDEQVRAGEILEGEYVKGIWLAEFKAVQKTRKWYVVVYLPHAKKYQLPTNPDRWYCNGWWGPGEKIFYRYTDRESYPWNVYLANYWAQRSSPAAKAK